MTVSTSASRVPYDGNGVTVSFPVPFPFIQDDYLVVIRTVVATGVETILTLDSPGVDGYSVTGAGGPSGTVITVTAPTALERLTIIRSVPATQEADFVANDPLPSEVIEDSLDKLTMLFGDIAGAEGLSRVPKLYSGDIDGSGRYNSNGNRYANAADGVSATDLATVQQITSAGSGSFIQAGTGSVVRTMQDKARDIVSVKDFGAVGDGVTDDTAAIQAAIDSRPGEYLHLVFPAAAYRVVGPLVITRNNVRLSGLKAELTHDNTTGNLFELGDGVGDYADLIIEGFLFGKVGVASAGAIIRARRFSIVEIRDNYFFGQDKIYDCIDWEVGYQVTIRNNIFEKAIATCCMFAGTGVGADRCVDVLIYDNRFDYGATACYFDIYCEGIFVRRNIFLRQTNLTVGVIGSASWTINSIKIQENDFDGGVTGMTMEYAGTAQVIGNWFSSNDGLNISIGANFANGVFSGNQIYAQAGQNCADVSGDQTIWSGNLFSGGQQGLAFFATVQGTVVTGNTINNMTGSAINLFDNPDAITIVGNNFLGNGGGVSAGGTNLNVANNLTI